MSSNKLFSRLVFESTRAALRKKTGHIIEKRGPQGKRPILERIPKIVFGKMTKKGKFVFDRYLVPLYPMPDMTDCKFKPYVSHKTPRIEKTDSIYADDTIISETNK
ncbi:ribosomal protein mL41 [Acrasis kona]|uniref:Ribosomal protein mL41 n=1 Tax=Acrasis kona TaxID=1008807 RepID=A0AAW2ZBQ1_9EUKA